MIELIASRLTDCLPENLRNHQEIQALAYAIGNQVIKLVQMADGVGVFCALDHMDHQALDYLAVEFRIVTYEQSYPIETKRALIRNAMGVSAHLGTAAAVQQVATTIFGESRVEEWFDYGGEPYHFRVITSNVDANQNQAEALRKTIDATKNLRSILEDVLIEVILRKSVSITEEVIAKTRIYHYGLGYWRLGKKSFASDEPFRVYQGKLGQIKLGKTPFANGPKPVTNYNYPLGGMILGLNPFASNLARDYTYHLGQFQLGTSAFADTSTDTIMKPEEQHSIQPVLKTRVTQFMAEQFDHVQVNQEILIPDLSTQIDDTTMIATYRVAEGTEVTAAELVDADGTPLVDAQMYIPAGVETMVRNEIKIQEGNG